jgi:hypothetical protein
MQQIFWKRLAAAWVGAAVVMGTVVLGTVAVGLVGCSDFRPKILQKYVYVTAKQGVLKERVAAVSNHTGTVTNGEKLVLLERSHRFVKVQTPTGEVGWIEESKVADQAVADQFEALGKAHEKDPVVGTAVARDEVYLHLSPGRKTAVFYRLAEGDSLKLLERATIAKPVAGGAAASAAGAAVEPAMEDWWLAQDAKGQMGWVYARMIDVSAPDALERYAEGQRIVGAYLLANADDPDSGVIDNGVTVTSIPQYVTVLAPYKAGLPYDFDQVRVFTWNTKKHRYETAFREHNVAGYLPVVLEERADPYGKSAEAAQKLPSFTYRVLAAGQALPVPDPTTGIIKPGKTVAKTYRLEGNLCRRVTAPGSNGPEEMHLVTEEKKDAAKGKRKGR